MAGGNFLGINLPFGMSNRNNNTPAANPTTGNPGGSTQQNPNFPAATQLQPKNGTHPAANGTEGVTDPSADPNNNADPNKGQGSQLDNYKDIFTLPTDDKGQPIVSQDPFAEPILRVDPAALQTAAKKMNFVAGIDQDTLQKAMSGQDPTAFMTVLNAVAQNGFAAALHANAGVVERALNTQHQRFESVLPDRIRATQINQAQPKHEALSHPAVQPVIAALKTQIAAANQHLTPEQVAAKAEGYVIAMANDISTVNERQNQQQSKGSSQETDWTALLGG